MDLPSAREGRRVGPRRPRPAVPSGSALGTRSTLWIVKTETVCAVGNRTAVAKKRTQPKQHFPTPDERDGRVKIEGVSEEEALKILLGALNDPELRTPGDGGPTCSGYIVEDAESPPNTPQGLRFAACGVGPAGSSRPSSPSSSQR
jgi:hypothetical protein